MVCALVAVIEQEPVPEVMVTTPVEFTVQAVDDPFDQVVAPVPSPPEVVRVMD